MNIPYSVGGRGRQENFVAMVLYRLRMLTLVHQLMKILVVRGMQTYLEFKESNWIRRVPL